MEDKNKALISVFSRLKNKYRRNISNDMQGPSIKDKIKRNLNFLNNRKRIKLSDNNNELIKGINISFTSEENKVIGNEVDSSLHSNNNKDELSCKSSFRDELKTKSSSSYESEDGTFSKLSNGKFSLISSNSSISSRTFNSKFKESTSNKSSSASLLSDSTSSELKSNSSLTSKSKLSSTFKSNSNSISVENSDSNLETNSNSKIELNSNSVLKSTSSFNLNANLSSDKSSSSEMEIINKSFPNENKKYCKLKMNKGIAHKFLKVNSDLQEMQDKDIQTGFKNPSKIRYSNKENEVNRHALNLQSQLYKNSEPVSRDNVQHINKRVLDTLNNKIKEKSQNKVEKTIQKVVSVENIKESFEDYKKTERPCFRYKVCEICDELELVPTSSYKTVDSCKSSISFFIPIQIELDPSCNCGDYFNSFDFPQNSVIDSSKCFVFY